MVGGVIKLIVYIFVWKRGGYMMFNNYFWYCKYVQIIYMYLQQGIHLREKFGLFLFLTSLSKFLYFASLIFFYFFYLFLLIIFLFFLFFYFFFKLYIMNS